MCVWVCLRTYTFPHSFIRNRRDYDDDDDDEQTPQRQSITIQIQIEMDTLGQMALTAGGSICCTYPHTQAEQTVGHNFRQMGITEMPLPHFGMFDAFHSLTSNDRHAVCTIVRLTMYSLTLVLFSHSMRGDDLSQWVDLNKSTTQHVVLSVVCRSRLLFLWHSPFSRNLSGGGGEGD